MSSSRITRRSAHESGAGSGSGSATGDSVTMSGANTGTTPAGTERSLDEVMREPSTNIPDVLVIDVVDVAVKPKQFIDPKKDLWLSTVDGRHQSPIVPIRVGPYAETFYVHRAVLTKAEYFRKALDGQFKEAEDQAIDLPEEEPAIFSFVVAYLYESSYEPLMPIAEALISDSEKGKGKETTSFPAPTSPTSDSESSLSDASNNSARSRRRHARRQRRQHRAWEQRNRKEPHRHRVDCSCGTCTAELRGPPCWNCGVSRVRPLPPGHPPHRRWYPGIPPPPGQVIVFDRNGRAVPARERERRRGERGRDDAPPASEPRMGEEDLRTWVMAYELSIDVYVCAERYLMEDFKLCIAERVVDDFEKAGQDAAQVEVLLACKKLHAGVSANDALLRKVFARVGFLLVRLWKKFPEETHAFWMENPDVGGLIMKETMERREEEVGEELPSMDRVVRDPVRDGIHEEGIVYHPGRRVEHFY